MRALRLALGLSALVLAGALAAEPPPAEPRPRSEPGGEPPLPTGIVEKARARLVQIDVTVLGPPEVLESLTKEDFKVKVGGERLSRFEVDRLCRSPVGGGEAPGTGGVPEAAARQPASVLPPTTILFYFDQPHLTMEGRQEGIDLARRLAPELLKNGNRAMLVSSAERIETLVGLTSDPEVFLAALDKLERDRDQWDLWAEAEEDRVADVLGTLGIGSSPGSLRGDAHRARTLAKLYYQEELWRAERDLRRFALVLGRLAAFEPPKIAIYLADNMRTNAGHHYVGLFGEFAGANPVNVEDWIGAEGGSLGAQLSFDRVVDEASAGGVRLYTIEARGLATASHGAPTTVRFRHARETLSSLAAETGGRAFLHGMRAPKIVESIEEDLACLYLISFDPADLPQDRSLRLVVEVLRPGVTAHVRGRLAIQSDSAALTSRLLAAFAAPESAPSEIPVRPTLIPTGYRDGLFTAVLQVAVPGSGLAGSTWDLGASVVSRGEVEEASARLTVGSPGAPVVLQRRLSFRPGPFEIVAVAHHAETAAVASRQVAGAWPAPDAQPAVVGPIAVVQRARAAIRRDDQVRTTGLLAFAEDEPVHVGRATHVVVMACKSGDVGSTLDVERQLLGETSADFRPLELDLGKDRCALIRDVIRPGTMTPGGFVYKIRILEGGKVLASGERRFLAWDGAPPASSLGEQR